ncbi:MAG: response regulator [Saprospiraceae bacterium]|nr:response regulator [Saprospiraceae bacterium]
MNKQCAAYIGSSFAHCLRKKSRLSNGGVSIWNKHFNPIITSFQIQYCPIFRASARTLLLLIIPLFLAAQKNTSFELPPAVSYHIQGEFDTLKLPALQWILEEGEQPLSYEQVQAGKLAGAQLLDLKASPLFPIKAHRGYWFKIRLTAAEKPDAFGLTLYRNGDCWPYEPTFKDVQTFSVGQDGKPLIGHSGTASPASKRDYPQHFLPSMIKGNIGAGETLDIWCRVTMAEPCNLQVDMELAREKIILSPPFVSPKEVGENIFMGACAALLFLATLLLIWVKKPVYLWFFIFQLAVLLTGVFTFYLNEIFNLLFPENPRGVIFFMLVATIFQVTSFLQLGRVYVGSKQRFPKAHFVFGITILFYILTFIFGTISRFLLEAPNGIWFQVRAIFTTVVYVTNILGVFLFLLTRDRLALFFCLGAAMPLVNLTYRIYELTFLEIPRNSGSNLFYASGMVLAMAFALAYRFRLEIKEKEAALKDKVNAELEKTEQQLRVDMAAQEAQRLSELDRMKSNFFANVTHELRTPLTLILGPLDNILKSKNLDNREFTQLKLMQQNGQDLLRLTNEILDLSKLEANKLNLNEVPVTLYPYLKRLVSMFETYAQKKGINLSFEYRAEAQLQVNLDESKFEKIVNNLLSNAFKFTPKNGSVSVKLEDIGHSLQLEVSDTGRGIHEEDLPHIFNRFYQSSKPNADEGGTGIGLALVQEYARLFGCSVKVESKEGFGSMFTVVFPKKQVMRPLGDSESLEIKNLQIAELEKAKGHAQLAENGKVEQLFAPSQSTILVVEDNYQIRDYIESLLQESYRVFTAENGQEALDWLDKSAAEGHFPDLIISDVMMPIMDGFQLLTALKTAEQYRTIPVIMLTAKAELDDKLRALRIGVDAYLIKPFVEEELLARVGNLLKNALARRQYAAAQEEPDGAAAQEPADAAPISQADLDWLAEVESVVLQKLPDYDFNLDALGNAIFMSTRQIRRRLKLLTGLSFSEYLNEARFREARRLLEDKEVDSVKRLASEVGMRDVKYFSQQFKLHFGKGPSEYLE